MSERDWREWHEPYRDPTSALSRRLAIVQIHLRAAIDRCEPGPIDLVSMCAGQGHDVIGVLSDHPRARDVRARLVEWDEQNVAAARVAAADLPGVEVIRGDAGTTDAYAGRVPAQIVLACGVFGNISDDDIEATVRTLPTLCARGATVIWTRHRLEPDLTPTIREWFESVGFSEEAFETRDDTIFGVGVDRLEGEPREFDPARRLFSFVGYDELLDPEQT